MNIRNIFAFVAALALAMTASLLNAAPGEPEVWTCSMHPQIRQPGPGKCPICGMDLIPVESSASSDDGERTLTMSESARALAEIQTTSVARTYPKAEIRLVGKLEYDETQVRSLTARFPARIDRLFVNYTGMPVQAGEHLAEVYSPELLAAQRELLSAYTRDPEGSLTRAARAKLEQWDLPPDQIESIITGGEPSSQFTLRAPIGGVVADKYIKEGDYVQTGQPLFKIVSLDQLWLFLDAYESDLPWLRYGQPVTFTVEAFPGETFEGTIAFIEPEINRKTRTVTVRVNVPNPGQKLKPGMFARGLIQVRLAEGGEVFAPDYAGKWISPMHPEIVKDGPGNCDVCGMALVPAESLGYAGSPDAQAPLVIPDTAVLQTGKRAVVYVAVPDAEQPTYEGREIVLGPRAGEAYVVASGLNEGDEVVTHGAFKIDSALQIQAKPSMMNPQGGAMSTGHNHSATAPVTTDMPEMNKAAGHAESAASDELKLSPQQSAQLLDPYLKLQDALASDDLTAAKATLKPMMAVTGHTGTAAHLIHTMMSADSLEALRRPAFDQLSQAMIAALQADPSAAGRTLYVMHCPMVYNDHGADWIQASEPLRNPYFGAMMLGCGETKSTISSENSTTHQHVH
ncbi:MAG: efflux RND transporter periplasmic adaptor subunit [Verrucomicrobiota bacterium JB024]|nr:efflux RND transporter periplasmic adaptor subunit [Verrucomicrobiota bacterium JB024]